MTDTAALQKDTGQTDAGGDRPAASSPAAPARQTVPARPARDTRLDIVRGWLQLSIFASHASGSWIGAWLIHGTWGLSDSSEQFVFLSGFTLGSVFSRKAARDGFAAAAADLLWRTWRLYRTQLLVFALYGLMVVAAGAALLPGEAARMGWAPLLARPLATLPAVLAMVEQPAFMGILPLFVWCMVLLPGFAAAEARWGDRALALPLALYGAVWALKYSFGLGWEDAIGFNPLAWQVLFLGGAWLGRRALLHGRALPFRARWAPVVTAGAATVLAAGLMVRLGWHGFVAWPLAAPAEWLVDKKDLAPARLLHALALAWLVAALVPREAGWMHLALSRWLAAIGRHSLQVFCVGLFFSWAASAAFRLLPATPLLDPLLIGAGCAGLGLFARWRERRRAVAPVAVAA
jgi:hypothetical protein